MIKILLDIWKAIKYFFWKVGKSDEELIDHGNAVDEFVNRIDNGN